MNKYYGWRGSGKTTTLLERAWSRARSGKKVLFIAPHAGTLLGDYADRHNMPSNVKENITPCSPGLLESLRGYEYDFVLIDESALCWQEIFHGKVDAISDSINDDYFQRGYDT